MNGWQNFGHQGARQWASERGQVTWARQREADSKLSKYRDVQVGSALRGLAQPWAGGCILVRSDDDGDERCMRKRGCNSKLRWGSHRTHECRLKTRKKLTSERGLHNFRACR